MSFVPSEYSYGGWLDDVQAAAEARYDAAVAAVAALRSSATVTALAPARAAQAELAAAKAALEAVADQASTTAADARAAAEAAKDTATTAAAVVPWLVGGGLLLGAFFLLGPSRRRNPADDLFGVLTADVQYALTEPGRVSREIASARGVRGKAYAAGRGATRAATRHIDRFPAFLRVIGIPV